MWAKSVNVYCTVLFPFLCIHRFHSACVERVSCIMFVECQFGFYSIFRVLFCCSLLYYTFAVAIAKPISSKVSVKFHYMTCNKHIVWNASHAFFLTPLTWYTVLYVLEEERVQQRKGHEVDRKCKICSNKKKKREVFFFFSLNDVEMNCWQQARQSLPALYLYSFSECYSQGQRKWVNSPFNTRYIRGN